MFLILQTSFQIENNSHIAGLTRRKTSEYAHQLKDSKTKDKWLYEKVLSFTDDQRNDHIISLISRIEDLKRIKLSLNNELRLMEQDKARILKEKAGLINRNDKLLAQINKSKIQLKQLELDISANRKQKFEQNCDVDRVAPIIFNPMKSVAIENYLMPNQIGNHNLGHISISIMQSPTSYAFDYSLCPLTSHFKFTIANSETSDYIIDRKAKTDSNLIKEFFQYHQQFTKDYRGACLTVSLLQSNRKLTLESKNNLIINLLSSDKNNAISQDILSNAAIAAPSFIRGSFRDHIDLIVPSIWQSPDNYHLIIGSISPHSPIERKYLASYFGQTVGNNTTATNADGLSSLEKTLQVIHRNSIDDLFLFIYDCSPDTNEPCYESREKMIEMSLFLIILPSESHDIDENMNDLLYLALSRGSIPVIIGKERIRLPFDDVLDWHRATIILPTARLPELHLILRSINPADLYQMKYHGRRIFENYLATAKQIIDTIISVMSLQRFNYPPRPIQDTRTEVYYSNLILDTNCTSSACLEAKSDSMNNLLSNEIFGPRERPFASQHFRRNFSLTLNSNYDLWNQPLFSPFYMFPSHPDDPVPPSEYKFLSSDQGYRPIGDGLGGSGGEFSRALGGDYPNEQFTIVLLTYERKTMLMKTLERLKGLAYLNKILVIWSGVHQQPGSDMIWPDVGVPIVVVKVDRNSLNNRFLPFDAIETDAIFSMDDDSPLRPDEIVFAFRVWRESRDRIVGFPGRYHAWDSIQNTWMYNSNHSCELSMVLTGGAFFHKYYSYLYSYFMPESIRSIVDRFMNCEDIAMNFLVAHLTRKPPIKVTSRWTFHCANCASSLSEDDSHFRERHECLNIFASIYGYMPLLSTQHRSDSILFKTRLPNDKQKCFKFV